MKEDLHALAMMAWPYRSGLADPIPNTPYTAPDSQFRIPPLPEKPRKPPRSSSRGKYPRIVPCLPKYAHFRCQITARNRGWTADLFATSRHPCDPAIGRRNAAKCVGPNLAFLRREIVSKVGKRGETVRWEGVPCFLKKPGGGGVPPFPANKGVGGYPSPPPPIRPFPARTFPPEVPHNHTALITTNSYAITLVCVAIPS